jgi:hypothetical protein
MSKLKVTAKNGTEYVYDQESVWDKEKKQARPKRKLIGHIDPDTGQIVPNTGRPGRKSKKRNVDISDVLAKTSRKFVGATYLFDKICEKLGLIRDLKDNFGQTYKMILSIAYYLILEDNNPLTRFEKFSNLHIHLEI